MTIYLYRFLFLPIRISSCTEYHWKLAQVIVQLDIKQFQLQINLLNTPFHCPCSTSPLPTAHTNTHIFVDNLQ